MQLDDRTALDETALPPEADSVLATFLRRYVVVYDE